MEKKGGASMSKWKIDAMSDYANSDIQRDQRQASGIGHDERVVLLPHPPPEDCIDLDDPPVQLPTKLSESGEDSSDNPLTSTPSKKSPGQDGTLRILLDNESMLIAGCVAQILRRARRQDLRCACRAAVPTRGRGRRRGCVCGGACGSSRTTSSRPPSAASRLVPALQHRCTATAMTC